MPLSRVVLFAAPGTPVIQRRPNVKPVVTDGGVMSVIGRRDVSVSRGQVLTLTCSATGSPDPTINWYKNGKEIRANDRFDVTDGQLVVKRVARRDQGPFECRAVNTVGRDRETVDVRLNGNSI